MLSTDDFTFWIGGSTLGPGDPVAGIRQLTLDPAGHCTLGNFAPVGPNPMFLAHIPGGLAVVHELQSGSVSALDVSEAGVTPRGNAAPTGAADPCHIAASPDGSLVFVTNYSGGTLTVHRVTPDGVRPSQLTVAYEGNGPRADRQEHSHPHQAVVGAHSGNLYVPDLGTDTIHVHPLAHLRAGDASHHDLHLPPGAGPRHLVIDGDYLIVANELDRTVTVIDTRTDKVIATALATESAGEPSDPGSSAIRLTNTGHVIVGNRGPNTNGVLTWDRAATEIVLVSEHPCGGDHPRDLTVTPDGRFVIVANQWSNNLTILELDPATSRLSTASTVASPSPACILPVRPPRWDA